VTAVSWGGGDFSVFETDCKNLFSLHFFVFYQISVFPHGVGMGYVCVSAYIYIYMICVCVCVQ
jgi:hypothetical protein